MKACHKAQVMGLLFRVPKVKTGRKESMGGSFTEEDPNSKGGNFLTVRPIKQQNSLPLEVTGAPLSEVFKKKLDSHFTWMV